MERGFNAYDLAFREHYQATYGTGRMPYDWYKPAYRHGFDMATAEEYRGREWDEAQLALRQAWEARNPEGAWEEVKEAVRHAWESARSALD
jgi:hypothetical protein